MLSIGLTKQWDIIKIKNNPMNLVQIEENIQNLIKSFNQETFIYDLILAYGLPKSSVSKLKDFKELE